MFQLNVCVNLRKLFNDYIYELIESILLVIFAILLLIFSSSAIEIVITILGSGMIVLGLFIAVKTIIQNKKIDKCDEQIIETTIVEDENTDNKNSVNEEK